MNTLFASRCIRSHVGAFLALACSLVLLNWLPRSWAAENRAVSRFRQEIEPILIDYCYRCHANGTKKGGVAFDEFVSDESLLAKRELWSAVLKNVRAGIMPPAPKPGPSHEEVRLLTDWIKQDALGIDSNNPDPGRVTIRRLNRVEYANTIRDLMDFDFKAEEEFPPDDTGYGFDTIGDVLTVSPLLLEKYMHAAEFIVARAVPTVSLVVPERTYPGPEFHGPGGTGDADRLTFHTPVKLTRSLEIAIAGDYRIALELSVVGPHDFDPSRCAATFKLDDRQLVRETYTWQDGKKYLYTFEENITPGDHKLTFEVEPLTSTEDKPMAIYIRLIQARVQGPLDQKHWTRPANYDRFWPEGEPDRTTDGRRRYVRDMLQRFATRAFRRPVDDQTLERLVAIAERIYEQPGRRFADGVARSMVAVLASPRFVFRVEETEAEVSGPIPAQSLLDEYALASRLSYFLWSTMPDDELFRLAERHELRENLAAQVTRMRLDARALEFTRNFVGQWLQVARC